MTFVSLGCLAIMLVFAVLTVKPLREALYEDIFHKIGANINSVESHKSTTAFFGTNKVDLITHLLYLNTLAFLCYDFTLQNNLDVLPYWILLSVFGVSALANNFHGYRTVSYTHLTLPTIYSV